MKPKSTPPTLRGRALALSTCPDMHDHGTCAVSFHYRESEPLVFTLGMYVQSTALPEPKLHIVELSRDVVRDLVTGGVAGTTLVLGSVSLKLRLSAPHQLSVKMMLTDDDGDNLTSDYFDSIVMIILARSVVADFIAETYAVVPADAAAKILDAGVDRFLADVLGGAR